MFVCLMFDFVCCVLSALLLGDWLVFGTWICVCGYLNLCLGF